MKSSIRQSVYILRYLFQASHILVVLSVLAALLAAIPAVLSKLLVKWVLDDLERGTSAVFSTLWYVAVFILAYEALNASLTHVFLPLLRQKALHRIQEDVLRKASGIDLGCFDDPQVYQSIAWTKNAVNTAIFKTLDTICMFVSNMAKLILISALFIHVNGAYLLFAAAAFFVTYFLNAISSNLAVKKARETMEYDRAAAYCHKVFSSVEYAKEMRLFLIGRVITEKFRRVYAEKRAVVKKYLRKIGLLSFLQVTIPGYFISEFCLAMALGYQILVQGDGSIGDFTMIYSGINSILAAMFALIGPVMQGLSSQAVSIERLRAFMDLESEKADGVQKPEGTEHTLEIEEVSFAYNGGLQQALKNLNMSIKPHAKVAIVGANGSGKSTLVKLLMRLYDVDSGSISLDGTPVGEYETAAYQRIFACIFQDFPVYALSVGQNISMRDSWNEERMARAIALAELRSAEAVTAQSQLLKMFSGDGLVLSGGQTQKLVLARLFYRGGDILIMDEPSASLDPVSEYEFNKRVSELFAGKTVILITHRLSATKDADVIFFLKNGTVAESGTHQSLLSRGGEYAAMWVAQAQKFKENPD